MARQVLSPSGKKPSFPLAPGPIFAQIQPMRYAIILVFPLLFLIFSCSPNNVTEEPSLGRYFDSAGVEGCFGLNDNGQGHFTIYQLKRYRDSAFSPASTFKIVNSLIGLETGVISDEKMVIPWDGVVRSHPEWNKDLSMEEAFRVSAVNYYQEVARRIGYRSMKHWIDTLGYGNRDISGRIDSFWLNSGPLRITADEQLGLVKKLYFDQLPFLRRSQEIVHKVMLREDSSHYRLSYKTGWGKTATGKELGWIVGWIEENNHPYFFVLNLDSPDSAINMSKIRLQILKGILASQGFFHGNK
jgi:beta-lactamase class D